MEYTFKSDQKTVYLEMPYKLVITSSSGIALSDGSTTLTASVVDVNTGDEITVPADSFTWTRREQPDGFQSVKAKTLDVKSADLVNGSATFICSCKPASFYWADTAMITLSASVRGENGWSTATLQLYKRSATKPAAFDGEVVTYKFSTGVISGDLGTWSKTVPSGADPLYIIYGSAFSQTDSDTIQPNEWTEPAQITSQGTEGEKGSTVATVIIFQRSESKPAVPSEVVTYSFISGQFTGLGSWSSTIPDGTVPCWATTATAVSKTDSDTIQPSEWADPKKVFAVGEDGQSAPYQRQIFKASEDKPATPTGNAESVPDGWSLQIPQRTGEELIWVSSAYVVYNGTTPIYSEWSEPTQYSGKDGTTPIVEWQWGKSSKYPPDVANYTFIYNNAIVAFDNAVFVGIASEWHRGTIPEQPEGYEYLWKREYDYESGQWNVYLANGPNGLKGNYKGLGYVVVGTNSVVFAGVDNKGEVTLDLIELSLGGNKQIITAASFTLSGSHDIYYLITPLDENLLQSLKVVYLDTVSDGSTTQLKWVNAVGEGSYTSGYVLAEIFMSGDTIESVNVIEPRTLASYSKTFFMTILNSETINDNITEMAEALGVERVFTRVAALEAFINRVFANYIWLGGAIYSGCFDEDGNKTNDSETTNGAGFYVSWDGILKAVAAEFERIVVNNSIINGQFTASDAQGILFKSVSNISDQTITDTETRYSVWSGTTCSIDNSNPPDYEYMKISGHNEWFIKTTGTKYRVFTCYELISDFGYDYPINEDNFKADSALGYYILGYSVGVAEFGETTFDDIPITSSEISVVVAFRGSSLSGIIIRKNGNGIEILQGSDSQISVYTPFSVSAGDKISLYYFGDAYNIRQARLYLVWTGGPKAPVYNNGRTDEEYIEKHTYYKYLFLEDPSDCVSSGNVFGDMTLLESVPKAVYLEDSNPNKDNYPYVKYDGPTVSLYNSNKSFMCYGNGSSMQSYGMSACSSYASLFAKFNQFAEGDYYISNLSSYFKVPNGSAAGNQYSIRTVAVRFSPKGTELTFYSDFGSNVVMTLKSWIIYQEIVKSPAYYIVLQSSIRGIQTASIMPTNDEAMIGSNAERYKSGYFDGLNTNELTVNGSMELGELGSLISVKGENVGIRGEDRITLQSDYGPIAITAESITWNGMEIYNDNGTLKIREITV